MKLTCEQATKKEEEQEEMTTTTPTRNQNKTKNCIDRIAMMTTTADVKGTKEEKQIPHERYDYFIQIVCVCDCISISVFGVLELNISIIMAGIMALSNSND